MKQKRILSIFISLAAIFFSAFGNITFAYEDTTELTYLDCTGSGPYMHTFTQTLDENYTLVTSDLNRTWTERWYVVKGNVTVSQRILLETQIHNEVHLLLCNNSKLTAENGIRIPWSTTLYIHSQSDDPAIMGELYAKGYDQAAGIGGDISGSSRRSSGTLIINGGRITAEGGSYAAGIGATAAGNTDTYNYSTTINGGIVTAIGGYGAAGIGGSQSSYNREITINGGTVTARGGYYGAGIGGGAYASGGTIEINGGSVNAVAGGGAEAIGNGGGEEGTMESTVQNYKRQALTLKTYRLMDIRGTQKVESIESSCSSSSYSDFFTNHYSVHDVYNVEDDALFFYLPSQQDLADLTVTQITMKNGQVFEPESDSPQEGNNNIYLHCAHAQTTGNFCVHCGKNLLTGEDGNPGGDASNTYTISTSEDLVAFAEFVNSGYPNTDAVLTSDISIVADMSGSTGFMLGNESIQYSGTFDGQNHTIDVSFTDGEHIALFNRVCGATIKNLTVTGSISAERQYAAGLVSAVCGGNTKIENCLSRVHIAGGTDGEGKHGGLVGEVSSGSLSIKNCAFVGEMFGKEMTGVGGLIGWAGSDVTIENSFVAANFLTAPEENLSNTISRNPEKVTLRNCYYVDGFDATPQEAIPTDEQSVHSGELAYMLNGETNGGTNWYQNIDNEKDPDDYPVPHSTHGSVYRGYTNCYDFTAYFSNTETQKSQSGHSNREYSADDETDTITCQCTDCGSDGTAILQVEGKVYDGEPLVVNCLKTGLMQEVYNIFTSGCCSDGCRAVGEHTFNMVVGDSGVSVTKKVTISDSSKFRILRAEQENGNTTATVYFPIGGKYTVVFADYTNGGLNAFETAEVTVSDGETASVTSKNGIALGKDDKIMLWNGLSTMVPLCDTYTVE